MLVAYVRKQFVLASNDAHRTGAAESESENFPLFKNHLAFSHASTLSSTR